MGRKNSRELMAVQRRVEAWRRRGGGGRGSRIPEELWNEAVEVAQVAGVHATARALRFNYERLKERAGQSAGKQSGNASEIRGIGAAAAQRRGESGGRSHRPWRVSSCG